jgi:WD40 repeat protein
MKPARHLAAVCALLFMLSPAAPCLASPSVERLQSPTSLDLHAVAWRPGSTDSWALIAGDQGALLQYTGHSFINLSPNVTGALRGAGWNPTGTRALVVGDGGTVLDYDGISLRFLSPNTTGILDDVKWRPQGDMALIAGHNGTVLKYSGGNFTRLDANLTQPVTCVAWRPDGRMAFLCGDFPFVVRYDPDVGTFQRLDTGSDLFFLRFAAWRPDGGSAIVMGTLGMLFRYDGTRFSPINSPTANQWLSASWSQDSSTALLSARGGLLYNYSEASGNMTPVATNTTSSINCISYNPNGSLAIGAGDGGLVVRYPAPPPGPVHNPPGGDGSALWLVVSAAVLLSVSLLMVAIALLMVHRSRKKERERRDLEEAEARASEVAAAKARSKGKG